VLVGDDGSAVLMRRQWTPEGISEAVLLAAARVGPDTPEVLATATAWGCDRVRDRPGGRGVVSVWAPDDDAPVVERFLHLAALAATRVETAVALARGTGEHRIKADGSPSIAADEAAHLAAAEVFGALGLPVLSEERADLPVTDDGPWVVVDPLDGTGNFRAGRPRRRRGRRRPVLGAAVVGRRAGGVAGRAAGAAAGGQHRRRPVGARRGSGDRARAGTAGAGSAAAWHDIDRSGTHVHDVAGALAVLASAGGVALDPQGRPVTLRPDTATTIRFVAASSEDAAIALLSSVS
jgi:3'(2'), 5'-bisphosphate nucleotidase